MEIAFPRIYDIDNQITPSDMTAEEKTIASEILKKHLVSFMDGSKRSEDEDLQIIYKCALLAMEEYAQLKLSEHSTKEQEVVGYLCDDGFSPPVFTMNKKQAEQYALNMWKITPLTPIKKTV